ncbi:hypothetical protein V8F33_012996 [Rhypophila sp. PSN 637]
MYQTREARELVKGREDEIVARAKAQSIARHGDESAWKLHMLAEVADLVFGGSPATPATQRSTAGPSPVPEMRSPRPVAPVQAGRLTTHHLEVRKVERTIMERVERVVLPPLRPAPAPAVAPAVAPAPAVTPGPGPDSAPAPVTSFPGQAPAPGSVPAAVSSPAPAATQAATPGPLPARVSPATPGGTQSPAPVPGSPSVPLRTQQAHNKSLLILGEGSTTHPDKKCTKCRPGNYECIVNKAVGNGNTCARCARNKEKCSHQQVAEGKFIREHGRPARDGPCQNCKERAKLGRPAECYQADPTDKTQLKYGTACSQCCIEGTKDSCSLNQNQRKKNGKHRKS